MANTLVVYTTQCLNDNVSYFVKHGLIRCPEVDYIFVSDLDILPDYVTQLPRQQDDYDSWLLGLDGRDYDYYILLNSEGCGPYLPKWAKTPWYRCLTKMINYRVKLAGSTIGYDGSPYVDSYAMVTDRTGLSIIRQAMESRDPKTITRAVLDAGYDIACLLLAYRGLDYRVQVPPTDFYKEGVHPFETVFINVKTNMERAIVTNCTEWRDVFDWREYLYLNRDVANVSVTPEFALQHWEEHGKREGRRTRTPLPFDSFFDPHRYLDKYPDLRMNGVDGVDAAVHHFLQHGVGEGRNSN